MEFNFVNGTVQCPACQKFELSVVPPPENTICQVCFTELAPLVRIGTDITNLQKRLSELERSRDGTDDAEACAPEASAKQVGEHHPAE
jgi:hypothetical protein